MSETKQAPFAWQDKRILRRIRESVEDYGSALAVYCALTVVASDAQKEEFQTTQKWLGQLSGFGCRTVGDRLKDLQRIKAVEVITPLLRAPSTYRLLPFGNGCRTSGNGCRAFCKDSARPLQTSEVSKLRSSGEKGIELGTAQRIGMENKLRILKGKLRDAEGDTAELWQREASPKLVQKRDDLRAQVAVIEQELGA